MSRGMDWSLVMMLASVLSGFVHGWQNYQGEWACNPSLKEDVYPQTLKQLQSIVQKNSFVKAVGSGHSWDPYIGCAGINGDAVNIVMTEFEGEEQVEVDLDEMVVKVPASMLTRDVLRYLDGQKSDRFPKGLSLRSYPWWIDQTLCGAVATGTHGSSMHPDGGSLSNQVKCLGMVLADGQYQKFCEDTHPEEMRALKVSAGRLGVIAHCYMKIIPSVDVQVERVALSQDEIADTLLDMQAVYAFEGEGSLAEKYPDTQLFWFPQSAHGYKWTYTMLDQEKSPLLTQGIDSYNFSDPESVQLPELEPGSIYQGGEISRSAVNEEDIFFRREPVSYEDLVQLAEEGQPSSRKISNTNRRFPLVVSQSAEWWGRQIERLILRWYPTGIFSYKDAFLQNPQSGTEYTLYDQYEFSMPVSQVGSCFKGLTAFVEEHGLGDGYRTPVLIRLVKSENNILLSNTNGEPRVYMNMNDDVSYNLEGTAVNNRLLSVANYLRSSSCNGRLHWGKTKATLDRDTDGFAEYPSTWCEFGRIANMLDPTKKFQGDAGYGSPHNYWAWENCGQNIFLGRTAFPLANCTDVIPPGSSYTCVEQKEWGKCESDWMIEGGFCASACERC